jgi:hypothetical protein
VASKRSISLPDELAAAVEAAAETEGVSFSSWLAAAAARELRLREGASGIRAFEEAEGRLSEEERLAHDDVLRRMLSGIGVRGTRSRRR